MTGHREGRQRGHDPAALLSVAVEVAREAADLVRERRTGVVLVADTKSTATDVVTEADRASEELIRARLATARPEDGMQGEEGTDEAGESGVVWVADPIDGTVNFLYDIPQYAVSLAAQVDGESLAGVVVNAATGTTYTATLGGGAFRDGRAIRVRGHAPLGKRLIATGFGYDAAMRDIQAAAVKRLLPRIRDIRRMGSCALDLCQLAEGLFDGYAEEGVHLWDHAAGALIAREAGARTELATGAAGKDLLIVSPAEGFDELREALVDAGFFG